MKNIRLLNISLFLLTIVCNAQLSTGVGGSNAILSNTDTSNKNVGIGTTTPTSKLEVNGTITSSNLKFTALNSGSNITSANGRALSVDASGNVILVPTASTNIYTDDGTITKDRTVALDNNSINFKGNGINLLLDSKRSSLVLGLNPNDLNGDDLGKIIAGGLKDNSITFANDAEMWRKSNILNLGSLRSYGTDPESKGYRLLTFYDVPSSNLSPNPITMFAIEDRNDANRLRHSAYANGSSHFGLSDKNQSKVFDMYEDGTNAFFNFTKPTSYVVIGGVNVWPVSHTFWVKTGTSRFENDVFVNTNLGIGTTNFVDGTSTYKLSVKGKIRAEEIKVYNTWADYVFAKNYKLLDLKDLEKYIHKNGHLPNVPSANQITNNGLELGEMSKIQQEKIEELTLYIIKQNKEIEELKAQMKLILKKK